MKLIIVFTPNKRLLVGGSIGKIISSTIFYTCTKFHSFMKKCRIFSKICLTRRGSFIFINFIILLIAINSIAQIQ